jgi:hypothetical protein
MRDGTLRYAPNTPGVRVEGRGPGGGTYWRRRFVVMGVCLALLAAAAWSLSDTFTVQPSESAARSGISSSGAGAAGDTSPAGSAARRGHVVATNSHSGSKSRHAPGAVPPTAQAPGSAAAGGFGGVRPGFCPWHAIVLSVTANQVQFGPVQQPVFRLSVVSTQRTACSFDIGRGHLALVIREGSARIWSSGDCVSGSGSLITALGRGVPEVVAMAWNKNRSSPGCSGPVRLVPPGSYTAYGVDGPLVSAPLSFRLR